MDNTCVSSCRWCVLLSVVHPVLNALFYVICSLLM